jgi:hypothetical protein
LGFILAGIDAGTIQAAEKAFTTVINTFGPWRTILLLFIGGVVLAAWRIYNNWRKDKEVNLAIAAMERAVQRSAAEAREWKIVHLKERCNWTDAQVEKFILQNQFDDPATARNALESAPPQPTPAKPPQPGPAKRKRGGK